MGVFAGREAGLHKSIRVNVHTWRMTQTDGRGVCRSKDRANTGGDYIRQLSLEVSSAVQYMTDSAYPGSQRAERLLTPRLRRQQQKKKKAKKQACTGSYARTCFARTSVLWEVTLQQLLRRELQNLGAQQLSVAGLISAPEQPKPCDIGTKTASLEDAHTCPAHGCVTDMQLRGATEASLINPVGAFL